MNRAGLYELLTGRFADGRLLEEVPERQHLALSVADHIERLLNCREGALATAAGYGLPDTSLIHANQAVSREQLRSAIVRAVSAHEPRVSEVAVHDRPAAGRPFVPGFRIMCRLRGGGRLEIDGWLAEEGALRLRPRPPAAGGDGA
ncbi:type VI secretion system baseplate subunit TssE [Aquincola sp. MAHUQ-54]|uniref:Type VI secretion system baseplate subunit TssE n=1 Tax=Aquincola agrisoli TaxID=3119538 RepID=A0AAW9Q1Q6_9BURK